MDGFTGDLMDCNIEVGQWYFVCKGVHRGLPGEVTKVLRDRMFAMEGFDCFGSEWCGRVHQSELGELVEKGSRVCDDHDGLSDAEEEESAEDAEDTDADDEEVESRTVKMMSQAGRMVYCSKHNKERCAFVDKFVHKMAFDGFETEEEIMVFVRDSLKRLKNIRDSDGIEEPSSEEENEEEKYRRSLRTVRNRIVYEY